MPTILVTGGAGFIGSNIAAALAARPGTRVVICDRLRDGNKWHNLAKHRITDIVTPTDLFYWLEMYGETLDTIVHMGAVSSTVERDVDFILETNFSFSLLLWRWCAAQGKRFIYASSAATYGDGSQGFDDTMVSGQLANFRPLNPYGWSKHLFDQQVIRMIEEKEITPKQWAGLKFFNVYGPNEYHKGGQSSVIHQFTPAAMRGEPIRLFKSGRADIPDGGQMRDFIYVRDCVKIVLWLLDNPGINGLLNVGTGQARSFADLATAIFAALGREPVIEYVPMPEALAGQYQYFTQANTGRLRQLGYTAPLTSLEQGVEEYVRRYLAQPDPYL